MGRDDYRDDDDRPRRQHGRDEDYRNAYPPGKPRSRAAAALAVLNFVIGPLVLIFGICGWFCFTFVPEVEEQVLGVPGGVGDTSIATNAAIAVIIVWGAGALVTAIGLFYRAGWARILGLLIGGCALLVGLLYLTLAILFLFGTPNHSAEDRALHVVMSLAKTVFFLGYGTWTYIVLLHPKRVQEFR